MSLGVKSIVIETVKQYADSNLYDGVIEPANVLFVHVKNSTTQVASCTHAQMSFKKKRFCLSTRVGRIA